jgi:hypothetical protein
VTAARLEHLRESLSPRLSSASSVVIPPVWRLGGRRRRLLPHRCERCRLWRVFGVGSRMFDWPPNVACGRTVLRIYMPRRMECHPKRRHLGHRRRDDENRPPQRSSAKTTLWRRPCCCALLPSTSRPYPVRSFWGLESVCPGSTPGSRRSPRKGVYVADKRTTKSEHRDMSYRDDCRKYV